MLALQDCIGFSGLTPAQLEALADHEHLNLIMAAELAECILDQPGGSVRVAHIIADEVVHCHDRGDQLQEEVYRHELDVFVSTHI